MGIPAPVTLQQQYNLVYRENEYEVVPAALHNGIGILPWSPLAAGFLTGKFGRDEGQRPDARLTSDNPMNRHQAKDVFGSERRWETLDAVKSIADEIGATPSQVSLAWVRDRPGVTAPIIGARTIEQLRDNLGAADLVLDDDAVKTLDHVSAPMPDDYPYGAFGTLQRGRYIDSSEQALRELQS
jgi:aryl-alcohol dehydrogenase-like predicted oxidoreductase